MIKRAAVVCLMSGLLSAASGCGFLCRGYLCDPCAGPAYGTGACGAADCGDACGPGVARPMHCAQGPACEPCGDCAYRCPPVGPLTWFFNLLDCGTYPGYGCGERYWGDWWNYPPGYHPCDRCGNYIGGGEVGYGGARAGMSYQREAPAGYDTSAKARTGNCPTCNQPNYAARQQPTRTGQTASSQSAPRVISTTDRVARPARAGAVEEDGVPHLAQPRSVGVQR